MWQIPAAIAGSLMQSGVDMLTSSWNDGRNYRNWVSMNEYNSPANQVARLKEAGLSPMLAYGNVNTGNASSPPVHENVAFDAPMKMDMLSQLTAMKNQKALADAQVENIQSKTQLNRAELARKQHLSYAQDMSNIVYRLTHGIEFDEFDRAQVLDRSTIDSLTTELQNKGQISDDNISRIAKLMNLTDAQISKIKAEIEYIEKGTNLRDLEGQLKQMDVNFLDYTGGSALLSTILQILKLFKK